MSFGFIGDCLCSAPWYWRSHDFPNISITIPNFSISVSAPSVQRPTYQQPSLSRSFNPVAIGFSNLQLDPDKFKVRIDTIGFPIFNPVSIDEYLSVRQCYYEPNVPTELRLPPFPDEPAYDLLKKRFDPFSFMVFPYSIKFPPLPMLQDVLVPDIDIKSFPVLPENELEFIDFPDRLLGSVPRVNGDSYIRGSFLRKLGYVNKRVEEIYLMERDFFRRLFSKVERYLDNLITVDSFVLFVENMLLQERNNFLKHLSSKERALLRATFIAKQYKEVLKYKIRRIEEVISVVGQKLNEVIAVNNAFFIEATSRNEVSKAIWQNYVNTIKRNASLYDKVTAINKRLRELFLLYVGVFRNLIEGEVLNLERDRLIIENSIATLAFQSARLREELPRIEREVLLKLDNLYNKRLELLETEYLALQGKEELVAKKFDLANLDLSTTRQGLEVRRDSINIEGELVQTGGSIRLLENYLNIYKQMFSEYISVYREYIQTMAERTKANIDIQEVLPSLVLSAVDKLNSYISFYHYYVMEAMHRAYDLHIQSSKMIASAKLKSTIIESYS